MSATWKLFERWKTAKSHTSNNAAALDLGTTRQTVQNWKDGRNGEAHFIERMAKDLGEDPVPVILEGFAEAARDAQARKALQRLAKRFRGVGLAVVLGALPLTMPAPLMATTGYSLRELRHTTKGTRPHSLRPQRRRSVTCRTYHHALRRSA